MRIEWKEGVLGWLSGLSELLLISAHDLMVPETEPHVGLFADGRGVGGGAWEGKSALDTMSFSLSDPPLHALVLLLSLSQR